MRRTVLPVLAFATLALAGCTQEQFQDVETRWETPHADETLQVTVRNPDSVTVYRSVDLHPNLAVVCIDGEAFVTHTREAVPLHVPNLNDTCPSR